MYVRLSFGAVEFRMRNDDVPEFWERHGWVAYDEILNAAKLYKERGPGPEPASALRPGSGQAASGRG